MKFNRAKSPSALCAILPGFLLFPRKLNDLHRFSRLIATFAGFVECLSSHVRLAASPRLHCRAEFASFFPLRKCQGSPVAVFHVIVVTGDRQFAVDTRLIIPRKGLVLDLRAVAMDCVT